MLFDHRHDVVREVAVYGRLRKRNLCLPRIRDREEAERPAAAARATSCGTALEFRKHREAGVCSIFLQRVAAYWDVQVAKSGVT